MAHDQGMLDNVIAIAELIATSGTLGELLEFLVALDEDIFAALFCAVIEPDDLEPEDLAALQELAAEIGTIH